MSDALTVEARNVGQAIDNAVVDPKTYASPAKMREVFARLRRESPVHWTRPDGFRPFWTLTRHADIRTVAGRADIFLSEPRGRLDPIEHEEKMRQATGGGRTTHVIRFMTRMDHDQHKAYRDVALPWFAPKNLKRLEADIDALARRTIRDLEDAGGEADFARIATIYPLRVIMLILGIPEGEEATLVRLTHKFTGQDDTETQHREGKSASELFFDAVNEIRQYFEQFIQARRKNPGPDLISVLAQAQIDGEPMGVIETQDFCLSVMIAGHDTTVSTIANGMAALAQNPDQLRLLKGNMGLMGSATNEMLRWATPIIHFMRTAAQDVVVRDMSVKEGDALMLCFPSGNRDEEVFNDPYSFRIDRAPNDHVTFGYGAHFCIGHLLAKMEIKSLYSQLVPRLGSLDLAGSPEWVETTFLSGMKRLPISYRLD